MLLDTSRSHPAVHHSTLKAHACGRVFSAVWLTISLGAFSNTALSSDPAFSASGAIGSSGIVPGPVNLGMVFTPTENISVDSLGFYFATGLGNSETVALFDNTSQALLASTTVFQANPVSGTYIFAPITATSLSAGHQYVVDEFVNGSQWAYGSAPITAPGITYAGHDYVYGNALQFPSSTLNFAGAAYYGPNFTFGAAVPEPASSSLLLAGMGLLLVVAQRTRSAHRNAR